MKIVHEGRSGYIEIHGHRYTIEHIKGRLFCIHIPRGLRHPKLQTHLDALVVFARTQQPNWQINNQSNLAPVC